MTITKFLSLVLFGAGLAGFGYALSHNQMPIWADILLIVSTLSVFEIRNPLEKKKIKFKMTPNQTWSYVINRDDRNDQ